MSAQSFQNRITQTPDQIQANKVKFTVNKAERRFCADIDANQAKVEELQEQLELQLNSVDISPVRCTELEIEIEQYQDIVRRLTARKAELFPAAV